MPAGVENGQTVRMNVGNKEIFITFKVETSNYFRRDGADVHTDANISLSQALLGGTIRVQGVYEDQTIQVIPGTSSHTKICLTGKGLKRVNSYGNGNHYINFKILIPKKLTDKQKALIQAYAELEDDTPGQILGVTHKTDGKSASQSYTSTNFNTQGPKTDSEYTAHDVSDTQEYKKERLDGKFYFGIGVTLVMVAFIFYSMNTDSYVEQEAKEAFERRQNREASILRDA